jgi:O-antigen/teichoic acid export membrane protein
MEAPTATLTAKVGSGVFWSALPRATAVGLSFISAAVVARKLGPNAYGLMNMAQIAIGLISLFREIGIASAVVQRRHLSPAFLSSLFWMNAGLGCMASLVCFASAPLFAAFFKEPLVGSLLQVLSISFALTNVTVIHTGLLMREMSFRRLAILEVLSGSASLIVAIAFAYSGAGVWSLVASTITNATISTVGIFLLFRWSPSMIFAWNDIRSIASFSSGLSGFNLVNYFSRNADNLLVGKYLGTGPLGLYQFAYIVMLYPLQNVSQLLGRVIFPALAQMQDDNPRFRQAYLRSCCAIAFITFPMMAGVAAVADPFVRVWLGPKWLPVIGLLQVLATVGMLQSIGTTVGQIYSAKGRTGTMFAWGLGSSIVTVGSFVIGLHWGIQGVAIAYAAAMALLAYPLFRIPFGIIGLPMSAFVRALAPYVAATGVMFAVVLVLRRAMESYAFQPLSILLVTVPAGVVVYLLTAWMIRLSALTELIKVLRPYFIRLANIANVHG